MNGHSTATPQFVQQFDEVPAFWLYLKGLSPDDLITELVQNELDALSTHTRIVFHLDKLICEGNGVPVDADGWRRLAFIRGAGDRAPRKRYQLGVKNHGLKACFTIGDKIWIQSDGKRTVQTLYMHGAGAAPSPGAYPHPVPDATAPQRGCRVVVPYRTTRLRPGNGEVFDLHVPSQASLERLFRQASIDAPERFIGALVPGVREAYTLEIVHHGLGTVIFRFSCSPLKGKRTKPYFRRKCEVSGNLPSISSGVMLQEQCHRWAVRHPEDVGREIPEFYAARNNRFFIEIAWKVTARGVPASQAGRRRYPIAYALDSDAALTGMGVHISAPYVSDSQRHGAVTQDSFNDYVDQCAREKLLELLKRHIVPAHGAGALCLLYNTATVSDFYAGAEDDPLVLLIDQLINARAVPLANAFSHSRRHTSSRKRADRTVRFFGPRVDKHGNVRRVLVPVLTWEPKISEDVTRLCPVHQDIMHPDVPSPIVARLAQGACMGWNTAYVTFDEKDVAQRWMADPKASFPWDADADWRAEFSNPSRTREYMDVVFRAIGNDSLRDDALIKALQREARVPDRKRVPRRVARLYTGYDLPHNFPLTLPVLHPELSTHRLWSKKGWRLPRLTFDEFLKRANMASARVEFRMMFWEWLATNHGKVPKRIWTRLAALPVWLDRMGELYPIDSLCLPRRKTTRRILEESLHIPHDRVLALPVVKNAKRGALRIRQRPTVDEVERFLERALAGFPGDRPLTGTERQAFQEVEKLLDMLGRDPDVSPQLEELSDHARGLNEAGALRKPSELVQSDAQTRQLSLLKSDLLKRTSCSLDTLKGWSARKVPSSEQVIHALRSDPQREAVPVSRLKGLQDARARERRSGEPWGIDAIPCIRVDGTFQAPRELAFQSTRGEYWGEWRKSISPSGLSAEVQELYCRACYPGNQRLIRLARSFSGSKDSPLRSRQDIRAACFDIGSTRRVRLSGQKTVPLRMWCR